MKVRLGGEGEPMECWKERDIWEALSDLPLIPLYNVQPGSLGPEKNDLETNGVGNY